jgi:Flp pilus assembly protein TadD
VLSAILGGLGAAPVVHAQLKAPSDLDAPAWITEADDLMRAGDWEGARVQLEALSRDHSEDLGLWIRLAFVQLQAGRSEAALRAAQQAYNLDRADLDAIMMLTQTQVRAGDGASALGVLEDGLRIHPENRQLLEVMTTLLLGMREWPKAGGLLRQLIRLHPEDPAYRLDLGRLLLNSGELDNAIASFRAAAAKGADPALCMAMEGKTYLAGGKQNEASLAFRHSNELRPNSDAFGGEATVHFLRGERGASIQKFRRAIELSPSDADLQFNLGNVLVQTERFEEAEEAFRTSLRLDSQSASAHLNLAVLLLNRFAVSEAEQHLRWAIQLDPGLAKPYLHLGRISGAIYDYATAIDSYRRYRALLTASDEQTRIDTVISELDRLAKASSEAIARGEMHLLQLMVSTEDQALAIIERVRRGEDFYVLAQQQSELADVAGVDSGFLSPSFVSSTFRSAIENLARGEMTPPIRAENGYYVFRRVE